MQSVAKRLTSRVMLCGQLLIAGSGAAQDIPLTADLRITANNTVAPGVYQVADPENDGAVIVEGEGTTVDFQGATLRGAPKGVPPDRFSGRGLVVRGRNIVVKNLHVHGYKVGIYAEDAPNFTLTGCDVSNNYRQHLWSTLEREDLADWLYGHENDENQWLRYGAGIYLLNCRRATISNCRARNGQNGLCLVRCDGAHIVDNDMSFMSGWGLAMWRSSRCDVLNNKFDWCIRGYSHGVYSCGQDSAGILVYEQCHDNVFAFNSATHGGDGFFLYAGNETLHETGTGGCNRNLVYRNDFSHAAANGIEATFSHGNRFIANILDECAHGVWAGYSYDSLIAGNTIRNSRNGVSIEHGRGNRIVANTIEHGKLGVHLWWDNDEDLLASAFGKRHKDCPSRENRVASNAFRGLETGIRLNKDLGSRIEGNRFSDVRVPVEVLGTSRVKVSGLPTELRDGVRRGPNAEIEYLESSSEEPTQSLALTAEEKARIEAKRGKQGAFLPEGALRGRKYIFVDEWGPYDFSDLRLWPSHVVGGASAGFRLLAPKPSDWRVRSVTGPVHVTPKSGRTPQRITVTAEENGLHEFVLEVNVGEEKLQASGLLFRADWHVRWYSWSPAEDPRREGNWDLILATEPLDQARAKDLSFMWGYRSPAANVAADHFATVAESEIELPAGNWRLITTSDDGVRVIVDGKEVLSNWTHHGPTRDEAMINLEAGRHRFRVEHFEIDGYACLELRLTPAP